MTSLSSIALRLSSAEKNTAFLRQHTAQIVAHNDDFPFGTSGTFTGEKAI